MPHSTVARTFTIDGHQVDVASLETIDFGRLATKDPAEVEKLLNASQMPGFFYLDLQSEPAKQVVADLPDVYALTEKYFDQPLEVKMKDYRPGQDGGFKYAEHAGAFEMLRDEMDQGKSVLPQAFDDHATLLGQFSSLCHYVNRTMLSCLSDALKLDDTSRFENYHREGKPSDTSLKLIYEPTRKKLADNPDTTHTDSGTLTLLFCEQWGVMLEHPESKAWAYIEPKPGCALINVADSLQSLSGKRLHSCRHRVAQLGDGFQKRHFVVAFLRPEKTA